jgi:hypothetical protein
VTKQDALCLEQCRNIKEATCLALRSVEADETFILRNLCREAAKIHEPRSRVAERVPDATVGVCEPCAAPETARRLDDDERVWIQR